jgi:hypothetical protein
MIRTKGHGILACALVLGCLAAPARGDEIQYLPDGCGLVVSADVAGLMKSKAFQLAKTKIKGLEEGLERDTHRNFGIPHANVRRVTIGETLDDRPHENMIVVTTVKPTTAAEIETNRKSSPSQMIVTYKKVKFGAHTVYEQYYQHRSDEKDRPAPVQSSQAFCVIEGKYVLYGPLKAMTKILERNKKPTFSPRVENALKQTGLTSALTMVLDIEELPEREKKSMVRDLGKQVPGLEAVAANMQTLTVQLNESGKVKGVATLSCKDAANAADVKKVADAGVVLLKGHLKFDPKQPEELQGLMKEMRVFLDAVKLSTKEAQVQAEVTVEPATAVAVVRAIFEATSKPRESKKEGKAFKDDK